MGTDLGDGNLHLTSTENSRAREAKTPFAGSPPTPRSERNSPISAPKQQGPPGRSKSKPESPVAVVPTGSESPEKRHSFPPLSSPPSGIDSGCHQTLSDLAQNALSIARLEKHPIEMIDRQDLEILDTFQFGGAQGDHSVPGTSLQLGGLHHFA